MNNEYGDEELSAFWSKMKTFTTILKDQVLLYHVPGTSVPGNNWHWIHFFSHIVYHFLKKALVHKTLDIDCSLRS